MTITPINRRRRATNHKPKFRPGDELRSMNHDEKDTFIILGYKDNEYVCTHSLYGFDYPEDVYHSMEWIERKFVLAKARFTVLTGGLTGGQQIV